MSEEPGSEKKPGIASRLGPIALGVAVAAVAGVAIWILGGDDEDTSGPAIPEITAPAGATAIPGTGSLVPERPEAGEPAPDFALIDARDETKIRKLSDYFGTPIVLNWYATWCGPCERELPVFADAQEALGDEVQFIGVNFNESAEKAVGMLEEYGADFPALLDRDGRVSDHWRNSGLPATYFIDADGILRRAHRGPLSDEQLVENLATIGLTYTLAEGDD